MDGRTPAVLGVDGGGTKTHAAVVDADGALLGFGMSDASNWENVGIAAAAAALRAAVRDALSNGGIDPGQIVASVFGLAGIDFPSDAARISGVPEALGIECPTRILNDSFVALRAGARRPWGVVVVAGTGSVTAGRNPAGETFRTFGLGPMFGDAGSASEISEDAISAIAAALVGRGPQTLLTDRLCTITESASPLEFLEGVARGLIDPAGFAVEVMAAAEEGDVAARAILEKAGSTLGDSAGFVARRLGMADIEFEFVLAGAVFRSDNRVLTSSLEAEVERVAPRAVSVRLEAPPVVGAALLALELAELPVGGDVQQGLALVTVDALRRRLGSGVGARATF